MLIREVLAAIAETRQLKGKVVLDLCAGFQSLRDEVLRAGARYVAVDVEGHRGEVSKQKQPRRAAAVLCSNHRVLAVRRAMPNGSQQWELPGGRLEPDERSLHDAAIRALREQTGLDKKGWDNRIRIGPEILALPGTSYFAFALSPILSQAELRHSFAERKETQNIDKAVWIGQEEARRLQWREEDRAALQRLWGPPPHACVQVAAGG
jgi:8-oxo-dGTP pyrophosphatase MutT (NUDIX family)